MANLGSTKFKLTKTTTPTIPTTPLTPFTFNSFDDTFNFCSHRVQGVEFQFGIFSGVNEFYSLVKEDDVTNKKSEFEGWSSHLTNGRGVYRGQHNSNNCIWWHKQYRHWWLGDCQKRGNNHGFAYLQPDTTCPHDGSDGDWRRGGSDEVMKQGNVIKAVTIIKAKKGTQGRRGQKDSAEGKFVGDGVLQIENKLALNQCYSNIRYYFAAHN